MISLTPIINHLKTPPASFNGQWFRTIEGAAEYARRRTNDLPLPACWIVREADRVRHGSERCENTTFSFAIVIAISNLRQHSAGDTDDVMLVYRQAVKEKLLGFRLGKFEDDIKWRGGNVIEYTVGDLFWRDVYEFDALITNYEPLPDLRFESLIKEI